MKLVTDAAGAVTFLEPEWTKLTGQSVEMALGTGWLTIVHPNDRAVVVGRLIKANNEKQQMIMSHRLSLAPGDFKGVKTNVAPTISPSGDVIGLHGTLELDEKDDGLSDAGFAAKCYSSILKSLAHRQSSRLLT